MVYSPKQYAVEISNAVETVYYATGLGWADISNGKVYKPKLVSLGLYEQYMFNQGSIRHREGSSTLGQIELNNVKRDVDIEDIVPYGEIEGSSVYIYEIVNNTLNLIQKGVVSSGFSDSEKTVIYYKDPIDILKEKALLKTVYAGTNDGTTIFVEGDSDLKGRSKPLLLGDCSNANITPVLVNRSLNIMQLSVLPIDDVHEVMVGRAELTKGTQHFTLDDLITAATSGISAGTYDYYLGGSNSPIELDDVESGAYVALGTTPEKPVTFNATEGHLNLFSGTTSSSNLTTTGGDTAPDGFIAYLKYSETAASAAHTLSTTATLDGAKDAYFSVFVKREGSCDGVQVKIAEFGGNTTYVNLSFQEYDSSYFSGTGGHFFWHLTNGWTALTVKMDKSLISSGLATFSITSLKDAAASGDPSTFSTSFAGNTSNGFGAWNLQIEQSVNDIYYVTSPEVELSFMYNPPVKEDSSDTDYGNYPRTLLWKLWEFIRLQYNADSEYPLRRINIESFIQAKSEFGNLVTCHSNQFPSGLYLDDTQTKIKDVLPLVLDTCKYSLQFRLINNYQNETVYEPYLLQFPYFGTSSAPSTNDSAYVSKLFYTSDLLSKPQIRFLPNNDVPDGVFLNTAYINHTKNYTVMNESDIYGTELDDIPFVSEEWRTETLDSDFYYYKNAGIESYVDTIFTTEAGAAWRAEIEINCFGKSSSILYNAYKKRYIEILVNASIADTLWLRDIVGIENERGVFVIIGITRYFPSTNTSENDNIIKLQLWG